MLPPQHYNVGDAYHGPVVYPEWTQALRAAGRPSGWTPGPWPRRPTGSIGAELVVGPTHGLFSAEVKIGSAGSEHMLAAHLRIWPLGALYVHTERHGAWLQRRLNPVGYESRITGLSVHDWLLSWTLWAGRDSASRRGTLGLNMADYVLGPKRYDYQDRATQTGTVCLPDGDTYQVQLTLQRVRFGRARSRRARWSWSVDWDCRTGIPLRTGSWKGDEVFGASVPVSQDAVRSGQWVQEACTAIAAAIARQRSRYSPSRGGPAEPAPRSQA